MATLKLDLPLQHSCLGQKTISYLGPKTRNNLPVKIKLSRNVNTFKDDIEKLFFDELQKQNDDFFCNSKFYCKYAVLQINLLLLLHHIYIVILHISHFPHVSSGDFNWK